MEQKKDTNAEVIQSLRETRDRAIRAMDKAYQSEQKLVGKIKKIKIGFSIISGVLGIIIGMVFYPFLFPTNNTRVDNDLLQPIKDSLVQTEKVKFKEVEKKVGPPPTPLKEVKSDQTINIGNTPQLIKKYFSDLISIEPDRDIFNKYTNEILEKSLFKKFKIEPSAKKDADIKTKIVIEKLGIIDSVKVTINFYQNDGSRLMLSNEKSFLEVKVSKINFQQNLSSELSKISLK